MKGIMSFIMNEQASPSKPNRIPVLSPRSSNSGWSYRESLHAAVCGVFLSPTTFESSPDDDASYELLDLL